MKPLLQKLISGCCLNTANRAVESGAHPLVFQAAAEINNAQIDGIHPGRRQRRLGQHDLSSEISEDNMCD